MPRPDLSRVPAYFHNYISLVPEDDLYRSFKIQSEAFIRFLESIPPGKYDYRYAEGKWTLKELLQHVIDAERIFCFRALCFARKDATPLPSFDENAYAENSNAKNRNWNDLVEEFKVVRKATEYLFSSFNKEQLDAAGVSNKNPNYVLGIGFITIGHTIHHKKIIEERYL
jgi:uncharacterized damage-inducible protein DinB